MSESETHTKMTSISFSISAMLVTLLAYRIGNYIYAMSCAHKAELSAALLFSITVYLEVLCVAHTHTGLYYTKSKSTLLSAVSIALSLFRQMLSAIISLLSLSLVSLKRFLSVLLDYMLTNSTREY